MTDWADKEAVRLLPCKCPDDGTSDHKQYCPAWCAPILAAALREVKQQTMNEPLDAEQVFTLHGKKVWEGNVKLLGRDECEWTEDHDGNWETKCGEMFVLITGSPKENDMKFCCYCGKKITEKEYDQKCI